MPDFPARTRQILDRVLQKRLSKAEAARRVCVSRKTIYKWLESYAMASQDLSLLNLARPSGKESFKRDILRIVTTNPEFGPKRISEELAKREKEISGKTVWLILCEFGIQVRRDREIYAEKFRMPKQAADPSFPGHLRLSPEARKRIVEDVLLLGKKVSEVVEEYHISRKTLAKWKRRYLKAQSVGANLLDALSDQHPLGSNHPRGVSRNSVKAVLDLIISEPQLSTHKIAKRLGIIGNHGVQRVLERAGLSHYEMRLTYSQAQRMAPQVAPVGFWNRVKLVWEEFIPSLALAPPPKFRQLLKPFLISSFFAFLISLGTLSWIRLLGGAGVGGAIGLTFAGVALLMGSFFFLYSLKYYLTLAIVLSFSQRGGENGYTNGNGNGKKGNLINWILGLTKNGNGNGHSTPLRATGPVGLEPDLAHVSLKKHPFVSIHIPFYNEKNVVRRSIEAATNFNYPEYEIILADDSTDETSEIIRAYQKEYLSKGESLREVKGEGWNLTKVEIKPGVFLKHLHRTTRSGFKGGALRLALKVCDPRTEFISVFDADFVPYPDTLELFLKYFKVQNDMSEDYKKSNVAAVQGYQWHVLNKSENWITRGVRSEYAGSYVIERSGGEIYGGLKQISGAVYMIRKDVLEEVGWETSITEDFQLTLKLYEKGYKVVYTPYIQAPAECVSTLKRLIRQRMRWAEGHSNNVKRMFKKLLLSPNLTRAEKLEFMYLSPYYLQAFFFLIGTFSWLISETIFAARLPFWTSLWGWSLVLTNLLSLPLMNAVGLFLEESEERDYQGIASFVALSYILVPFQAYAAVKGFLEKEEGPWFRTPKTGRITDIFTRGRFYRLIMGILPGRASPAMRMNTNEKAQMYANSIRINSHNFNSPTNSYLALTTANNRFDSFRTRPKRLRWIGRTVIAVVLVFAILLNTVSFNQSNRAPLTLDSSKLALDGKKEFPIEGRETFLQTETPQFHLKIPNNQPKKTSFLEKLFKTNEAQAAEPEIKALLFDYSGVEVQNVKTQVSKDESGYQLFLPQTTNLKPGKYTLKASWENTDGQTYESSQDFRWGVLAINTNKSIYTPGEVIRFSFGVLDDRGATICDALLRLAIRRASDGQAQLLSTDDGTIKYSGECAKDNVTTPDYSALYKVGETGIYQMELTAQTKNGEYQIIDSFQVSKDIPFDIERTSVPTRIYPPTLYPVLITIKANQDFQGTIEETVPASFEITQSVIQQFSNVTTQGDKKVISWDVNWKNGSTHTLGYTIKFPRVSPEFYLIGPLSVGGFKEARSWQIAGDVVTTVFMETPDATNYTTGNTGTEFWSSVAGSVTYDTTQKKSGRGSWKADSGAGNAEAYLRKSAINGANGRGSAYFRFSAFPTTNAVIWRLGINAFILDLQITSAGILQVHSWSPDNQVGPNGSTLSLDTWYRISVAWTATSETVNEVRVFLNGILDISITNGSFNYPTYTHTTIGWTEAPGASKVLNFHHVYADDSSALTDPGDIRIAAKLPTTVNNNQFDTTGGTGAVNERPISEANYKQQAASSAVNQDYNLETAAGGDADMSGNTIVAYDGWLWAKRGTGGATVHQLRLNGSLYAITLTTTPAFYNKIIDSATYPSNAAAIGLNRDAGAQDTYFYEGGVLVAFLGDPIPEWALALTPLALAVPKIIKSIKNGTLIMDMADLVRKVWETIKRMVEKGISRLMRVYEGRGRGRINKGRKRKKEKWKDEENL